MLWFWIILATLGTVALALYAFHLYIFWRFIPFVLRAFQEKPLFIVPHGQPVPEAEEVHIPTTDGLVLHGCYLPAVGPRKGVILFGLEFSSNRWACIPYCNFLRQEGYDICAVETRGQGKTPAQPGYEPLQWVTDFDLQDFRAIVAYLKTRPDADPRGVGFFGLSKGGSVGLMVAAEDPFLRCCVTDGAFAAWTTMVPYMQRWIHIYSQRPWICNALPLWYYGYAARYSLRLIERERRCSFPYLEKLLPRLDRPLLMIHGGADNYIKPEMAQALFERVRGPKDLWIVPRAKHNQAIHQAAADYRERVLAFFDEHLADRKEAAGRDHGKAAGITAPDPADLEEAVSFRG